MIKRTSLVFLFCLLTLSIANLADASVLINFDPTEFTLGGPPHTYNSSAGAVNFNGVISNMLNGTAIPDADTGVAFLKNWTDNPELTFTFSFDVSTFDYYWRAVGGTTWHGQAYDAGNNLLGGTDIAGNDEWLYDNAYNFSSPSPVRKIIFWTTDSSGASIGDMGAIDGLNLNTIPEPATLSLLGLGLLGILGLRKKRLHRNLI